MQVTKHRAINHLLFWAGIFVFYSFSVAEKDLFREYIETTAFKLPLLMIAAYTLNYWQVPKYLHTKRYGRFVVSLILLIASLIVVYRIMGYYYLDKYCAESHDFLVWSDFPFHLVTFHFPALIMFVFKSDRQRFRQRERLNDLEHEKVAAELKYLKAQLNPHFLFNTLNNLYSFIINNSPKAASMVLQLSEILDYVLYRSQKSRVPVSEESNIIENYIALEEIRYGNNLTVNFNSSLDNPDTPVCPLILLSIVENAFKHGATPTIRTPTIDISLSEKDNVIYFSCSNTCQDKPSSESNTSEQGIGLTNIKRQLNLIYPNRHTLEIDDQSTQFSITMTLDAQ